MTFDWNLYIELAKELLEGQRGKDPYQEANLRSSISRAYYGIYGIARNRLEDQGTIVPDKDPHKHVREIYLGSPEGLEIRIGESLGRLLRRRNEADYEKNAIINFTEANTAYQIAYRTIQYFASLAAIQARSTD